MNNSNKENMENTLSSNKSNTIMSRFQEMIQRKREEERLKEEERKKQVEESFKNYRSSLVNKINKPESKTEENIEVTGRNTESNSSDKRKAEKEKEIKTENMIYSNMSTANLRKAKKPEPVQEISSQRTNQIDPVLLSKQPTVRKLVKLNEKRIFENRLLDDIETLNTGNIEMYCNILHKDIYDLTLEEIEIYNFLLEKYEISEIKDEDEYKVKIQELIEYYDILLEKSLARRSVLSNKAESEFRRKSVIKKVSNIIYISYLIYLL